MPWKKLCSLLTVVHGTPPFGTPATGGATPRSTGRWRPSAVTGASGSGGGSRTRRPRSRRIFGGLYTRRPCANDRVSSIVKRARRELATVNRSGGGIRSAAPHPPTARPDCSLAFRIFKVHGGDCDVSRVAFVIVRPFGGPGTCRNIRVVRKRVR